jgi:DNA-binding NtrC family response regulator
LKNDKRLLIVDDDEDILTAGELLFKRHFGQVVTCHQPQNIPLLLAKQTFDAVLLDMNFSPGQSSGEQGFIWLKRILDIDPDLVVVMITAHGGIDIAVEAIKQGATDFICKPWQNEKVIATLSAAVQLHQSRCEASSLKRANQVLVEASGQTKQNLLGDSAAMAQVHSIIRRSAPTDANVLIMGENGTGKELVARELHRQSLRADNVFMSVDLGAVSETLFESELFGHRKGAFTGADKDRVGRLLAANGGTLFLDEVGNLPLHLQAKLLTVLEQRQVTPLGANQALDIDVRVITATNVSREALADERKFRQDLRFRLNTVEITVPPLRQRPEDILKIASHYVQLYCRKYRKPIKSFSVAALEAACAYHWPGNVRALRHAVERAVILSEGETIAVCDLQLETTLTPAVPALEPPIAVKLAPIEAEPIEDLDLARMEKRLVEVALNKHQYNISKAAKELGLTRATLYRRIEKYGF